VTPTTVGAVGISVRQFDSVPSGAAPEPGLFHALDALMQRAYRANSFLNQIHWYTTTLPSSIIVAEDNGRLVGAGCCIAYTDAGFGWIGLIATEPGDERRGIGQLVTERTVEFLAAHGCAAVLDASAAGAPLYERMGFHDAGITRVLSLPPAPAAGSSPESPHDVADIAELDRRAFGVDRAPLLRVILDQSPRRAAVTRDHNGNATGFVIVRGDTIGPLVAAADDALAALVGDARAIGAAVGVAQRIAVPPGTPHLDALFAHGFEPMRELRHMRLGIDTLPGSARTYIGRASLGVG